MFPKLRRLVRDSAGAISLGGLLFVVIYTVVGMAMWPLIGGYVNDATNESHASYVGDDSAGLVSMLPIFYFLMLISVPIVAVIVMLKVAE
jgi:hypothetical protein